LKGGLAARISMRRVPAIGHFSDVSNHADDVRSL
jgi:hypothetical protein